MRLRAFPASGCLVGHPGVVLEGFQPAAYYFLVHYEEFRAFVIWQDEAVAQICAVPLNSSLRHVSEPTLLFVGPFQQKSRPDNVGRRVIDCYPALATNLIYYGGGRALLRVYPGSVGLPTC